MARFYSTPKRYHLKRTQRPAEFEPSSGKENVLFIVTVFLDNVVTELDPPLLKKLLETNLLQITDIEQETIYSLHDKKFQITIHPSRNFTLRKKED